MRICLLLVPVLAMAQEVPAGTEISIRLTSPVSTKNSKAADPVEAVVIAPVVANGHAVIAAGVSVHGTVEKVAQSSAPDQRATLLLTFSGLEIGGARPTMTARVASVD